MPTLLITGGAGFIGSALIRRLMAAPDVRIVNIDKLTYAAHPEALASIHNDPRYRLVKADICDASALARVFADYAPDGVMHLAAESHVDRAIAMPAPFMQTNLVGTFRLLEASLHHWQRLAPAQQRQFRFLQVSTDEVYGSANPERTFVEGDAYSPSSPYSASKAGADHLALAWYRTYGLPVLISHSTNNYGPYQHPEKLIPATLTRAIAGHPIPLFASGENVRDWIHVDDHVNALQTIFHRGRPGEAYHVSADNPRRNIDLVHRLCDLLDEQRPEQAPHRQLIHFVPDRPGHDFRYAIDASKLRRALGWHPQIDFDAGLRATVNWYLGRAAEQDATTTRR
ncbi:MAG TPA: dTDP-glucose 4,6-dehydratase [Solimonas sp.]